MIPKECKRLAEVDFPIAHVQERRRGMTIFHPTDKATAHTDCESVDAR